MTDVHTVSARLDTSSFEKLESSLKETARAGRQADAAVEGVATGTQRAGAGARSMASGTRQAASATQNMGAQARAATGSLNSMGAAMRQVNAHGQAYARTSSTAGFATANLAAQFNDIGVMLASGQSPLLLAAQQGTQINQILTQMRSTGQSTGRALVSAFTSIISPMSILTIGVIAGGAALGQWVLRAFDAGEGAKTLADRLDELEDRLSGARQATDDAIQSNEKLAESFGSAAAGMRGFLEELRQERLQEMRQSIVDIVGALERMATLPAISVPVLPRHTTSTGTGTFFDQIMGDMVEGAIGGGGAGRMPPPAWPSARDEALNRMAQTYEDARAEAERLETTDQRRLELMRDHMLPAARALLEARGGEDEALQETIKALQTAITRQGRLVGLAEKTVEVDEKGARAAERRAERAKDYLRSLGEQAGLEDLIARHGRDSFEVHERRYELMRAANERQIEALGLTEQQAEAARRHLETQIQADQMLRDRLEWEKRLTEEQRAREKLEREQLRRQQQLAREMARIRQEQLRPTLQFVDDIAGAWGDWLADGARDFDSFTDRIKDSFKRLLADMLARQAVAPIMKMLGLDLGGSPGGLGAASAMRLMLAPTMSPTGGLVLGPASATAPHSYQAIGGAPGSWTDVHGQQRKVDKIWSGTVSRFAPQHMEWGSSNQHMTRDLWRLFQENLDRNNVPSQYRPQPISDAFSNSRGGYARDPRVQSEIRVGGDVTLMEGDTGYLTPADVAEILQKQDQARDELQLEHARRESERLKKREDERTAAEEAYWARQAERERSKFSVKREAQRLIEGALGGLGGLIEPDMSGLPGARRRSAPLTELYPEVDFDRLDREFRRQVQERIGRSQRYIDDLQGLMAAPISYQVPLAEDSPIMLPGGSRGYTPGTAVPTSYRSAFYAPAAGGGLELGNLLMLYLMSSKPEVGLGLSVLGGLLGGSSSDSGGGGLLGSLFGGGGSPLGLVSNLFGGGGNGLFGGLFGGSGGGGLFSGLPPLSGLWSPAGFSGTGGLGFLPSGLNAALFGSQALAGTMAAPAAAQAFLSSGAFTANAGAAAIYGTGFGGGASAALTSGNGLLSVGANAAAAGGGLGAWLGAAAPLLLGTVAIGLLMSSKKLLDSGIELAVADDQLTAETYERWKKSRLFGLISSTSTNTRPLDEEAAGALRDAVTAMHTQVEAAAETLGFGADALENFSYRIKLSLFGLDEDERAAKVEETMKAIGDRMAFGLIAGAEERAAALETARTELAEATRRVRIVPDGGGRAGTTHRRGPSREAIAALEENVRRAEAALESLGEETGVAGLELEGARERMVALAEALTTVNTVLDQLGHTAFEASLMGGQLSESLLLLFSGMEDAAKLDPEQRLEAVRQGAATFQAAAGAYYEAFYTEAEKMQAVYADLAESIVEAGVAVPRTTEAYRELVEAQDLTTESGRRAYAALLKSASAYAQVIEYEERLATAREQAVAAELAPGVAAAGLAAQQARALTYSPSRIYAPDTLDGATSPLDRFRRAAAMEQTRGRGAARRSEAEAARSATLAAQAARQAGEAARRRAEAERAPRPDVDQLNRELATARGEVSALPQAQGTVERLTAERDVLQRLVAVKEGIEAVKLADELDAAATAAENLASSTARSARAASSAAQAYAAAAEGHRDFAAFLFQIRHLNLQFDVGAKASQNYAKTIVGMFEGVDEFTAKTQSYYQNFFTEAERLKNAQADLALDFDYLGLAMPRTRQEFRALVEAQDLTTAAGQKTFAALIDIADQFAALTEESHTLEDALRGQQGLFRSLSREIFVLSAPELRGLEPADDTNALLREIVRAIQSGNISAARQRADLLDEQRRDRYQPTTQKLPN